LHNYYPVYSNPLDGSIHEANIIMDLAIKKASLLVYSTAWAARSAIEDYHADIQKVHVVPFGANLESPPSRELVEARKRSDCCRLLFVGVEWQRKGGDIAVETLLKLEEMGIQAELIICGSTPPSRFSHRRMKVIPFLDKNDERQRKQLEKLYAMSDFLLVPTRCEAYGLVFCEAGAFGLPCIATDTGGVSEVIRDGENGFVLPYDAGGAEYAQVIAGIYRDDQRYAELVKSSRAAFENQLNWDTWGVAVKNLIAELIGRERFCEDTC
jgi:glycosyltransferase involved in cell wall biosynthesis